MTLTRGSSSGTGSEEEEELVEVINLWKYKTREDLHELMGSYFELKDEYGQAAARRRARQLLLAHEDAERQRRQHAKDRQLHVKNFKRDVMTPKPIASASLSSPTTHLKSNISSSTASASVVVRKRDNVVDDDSVTSWLAENYDKLIQQQQQQGAAGADGGSAGEQKLFIEMSHREQRLTQGQANRNEAILKMYEEQGETLNFALKPSGHGASVTVRTKRKADALAEPLPNKNGNEPVIRHPIEASPHHATTTGDEL